ncbi:MAG: biotin/lipoyl-binding protein, partial [Actinomycetota bacterium]|nr:biotin/lipoyl-binding protein [Actinomycetota bacterium]
TGIDLVEQQLRIAAGEPLALEQHDVHLTGHAIEARLYAESPHRGFLPSTGEVLAWREPGGDGVRIDAGIREGQEVTAHYDPMLAKVIAYGDDRAQAIGRLDRALAETVVLGVDTNIAFLRRLLAEPDVRDGRLDTGLIDRMPESSVADPSPALLEEAARRVVRDATRELVEAAAAGPTAWHASTGWRPGPVRPPVVLLAPRDHPHDVRPVVAPHVGEHRDPHSDSHGDARVDPKHAAQADSHTLVRLAGDGAIWVHHDGETAAFVHVDRRAHAEQRRAAAERGGLAADPELRAPMPGTVTAVFVEDGQSVQAGDAVLAIEAMKMEHRVLATLDGTVRLTAATGDLVGRDQAVARIEPRAAASDPDPSSGPHDGAVPSTSHQE